MTSTVGLQSTHIQSFEELCVFWKMYCPVYGCNSHSKKNINKELHFFSFPAGKDSETRKRREFWIEFCKRKAFTPTVNTRICSLHFTDDSYDPAHSPKFLKSISCEDQTLVMLKKNAVPTLNKPMMEKTETKQRKTSEERLRRKVVHALSPNL